MAVRKGRNARTTKVHTPKNKLPFKGETFEDYLDYYLDELERHGDDTNDDETSGRGSLSEDGD